VPPLPAPLDYSKFRAWADKNYDNLKIPEDCVQLRPLVITPVSPRVWSLEWWLQFGSDKYVRVAERYGRFPGLADLCRRDYFAYHYGQMVNVTDEGLAGFKSSDPVDIRIDNGCAPAHLHFGSPQPHHSQSAVKGLVLNELDMFTFVKGIFHHRKTQKPLDEVFGFRIE
jgi:hypothetical protein